MVDFRPASQKTNRVSGLITPINRKLMTRPVSEYNLIEAPTATWSNIPSAGQWNHGAYPAPAFAHPVVVSTSDRSQCPKFCLCSGVDTQYVTPTREVANNLGPTLTRSNPRVHLRNSLLFPALFTTFWIRMQQINVSSNYLFLVINILCLLSSS
jgi:hypothetical protein